SKVIFRDAEQPTTFNTADGSLTAIINGSGLVDAGLFAVNVKNSPQSLSVPVLITISSPGSPLITSINSVVVGDTTAIVTGQNFVPLSVVRVNGVDRATTFLGNTQLSFQFEAADTQNPGTLSVTVRNPDGTVSPAFTLTVTGAPVIPIH